MVKVTTNNRSYHVHTEGDTIVRFGVEGGSDFPRLRLTLIIGNPQSPKYRADAIFRAWFREGMDQDRAIVQADQREVPDGRFSFSARLEDLEWIPEPDVPTTVRDKFQALLRPGTIKVKWTHQESICWGTNQDMSHLSPVEQGAAASFRELRRAGAVEVLTGNHIHLVSTLSQSFIALEPIFLLTWCFDRDPISSTS